MAIYIAEQRLGENNQNVVWRKEMIRMHCRMQKNMLSLMTVVIDAIYFLRFLTFSELFFVNNNTEYGSKWKFVMQIRSSRLSENTLLFK